MEYLDKPAPISKQLENDQPESVSIPTLNQRRPTAISTSLTLAPAAVPPPDNPPEDTFQFEPLEAFPPLSSSPLRKEAIKTAPSPALMTMPSSQTLNSQTTKSAPANPLTTRHDVGSIHTFDSSSSSLNDTVADLIQPAPETPSQQSGFFNNMFTSLSFGKENNGVSAVVSNGDLTVAVEDSSSTADSKNGESASIISYRRGKKGKGKRGVSASSIEIPTLSPLNEDSKPYSPQKPAAKAIDESFSSINYANEKFKSTNYRYASEDRNKEFHRLFKSVQVEERLIEDFSCALSREILLQGRLYISEHNICFNSNLLGWVTNLVIPFYDILNFEKTATAGLFQNGIAINLKNNGGKHSFATFLSRDTTYNMFQDIWTAANDETPEVDHQSGALTGITETTPVISKGMNLSNETPLETYNHALMSIDGDSPQQPRRRFTESTVDSYEEEEDESDSEGSSSSDVRSEVKLLNQSIYKLKPESKYKYDGPLAHPPTKSKYQPEANNETVLATENLKCPPGVLFEIIFGSNNDLILDLLKSQDGKDFSQFSEYGENEDGLMERSYTYEKGLNYGVGPKSTTCNVKETIEERDYDNFINVVNTTQTPNVPSGGAFRVKTRYIITWDEQNSASLVVSFWVDWIGTSWMKGVIERSCKSGQAEATKVLVKLIKDAVDENLVESSVEVEVTTAEPETLETKDLEAESDLIKVISPSKVSIFEKIPVFQTVVVGLLFLIVLLQVFVVLLIAGGSENISPLKFLRSDPKTDSLLFKGEEILLWSWIDERVGRLNGSQKHKTGLLKDEIDGLINRWAQGDLNSPDGQLLLKEFEHKLNHYTTVFTGNEREKSQRAEALKRAIEALL